MNRMIANHRRAAGGFTLIEILIALLVLLVGLLGVAGIQLVSFQNNQGAYFRSQATFIAADFLDRIRANPAGQDADAYDAVSVDKDSTAAVPSCITSTAGCDGSNVAQNDIAELAAHFTATPPTLPGGSATVTKDTTTGFDEYIVTVSWTEKAWSGSGGAVSRDGAATRTVQLRTIIK